MIDSVSCAGPNRPTADTERFDCIGVAAEAESASRIRKEFADWLQRFFDLDSIRSSDLVLAINEALANAAEFAYLSADGDRPRTMDLIARYDPADARLTVTICDNGVWRVPATVPDRTRGRGIPLMRALSDRVTIETSTAGTRVFMQWDDVGR
jgi:anti-sigma regulatory factor (Ser/Thr protein kinase)